VKLAMNIPCDINGTIHCDDVRLIGKNALDEIAE
jgi:hypothetical protein